MKKIIMLGVTAAAILTSCSSDELYDSVELKDSNAIQFSTFINKSTRGVNDDLTNSNIADFAVFGGTNTDETASSDWGVIFNDERVYDTGLEENKTRTDTWGYGNIQYWTQNLHYRFQAIAPYGSEAKPRQWVYTRSDEFKNGKITFNNDLSNDADVAGTQDLLYSYQVATGADLTKAEGANVKVAFTFKHILSRVKFRFVAKDLIENGINYNPINAHYTIKNVRIVDAYNDGEFVINDEPESDAAWYDLPWTNYTTTSRLNFGDGKYQVNTAAASTALNLLANAYSLDGTNAVLYFGCKGKSETDHKYMIPVASEDSRYTLKFDVDYFVSANGHEGEVVYDANGNITSDKAQGTLVHAIGEVTLPPTAMKIGYSYVYTIDVNAKNIKVDQEQNPNLTLEPIEFTVSNVESWKIDETNSDWVK
jgi:hypothetical protein